MAFFLSLVVLSVASSGLVSAEAEAQYQKHGYGKPSYHAQHSPSYKQDYHAPAYKQEYPQPSYKHDYPAPSHGYEHKPSYGYEHKPSYGYEKPSYGHDYHYCDPKAAPKCAQNSTLNFCLDDAEYPEYEIKNAIYADYHAAKKYSDIADQSADDLVDGLTKAEESAFDYSFYTGAFTFDKTHWIGPAGYICPSNVQYARPRRAQNTKGEWRVIVQDVAYYTQTQRMETCLFAGAACRTLAPCYKSQCLQKYVYHRMLSFDPCDPYKGLFIDIYKLPSACSCHIPA
ncbi:neurotrophin 1-like [Artemia franciscana]|uniref:Spaetzle domain-containing protein n=1 Tax=Artemia franciscana TaxID=6661 RepID=A0AA88H6I6_ARTSF|nr:hypothetical protein QYM36_019915 [Artemia franciscana]KAK2725480.1 hypothetical protein QYM36_000090 [Artemia franciscana]